MSTGRKIGVAALVIAGFLIYKGDGANLGHAVGNFWNQLLAFVNAL